MLSGENQRRLDRYKAAVKAGEVHMGPLVKKKGKQRKKRNPNVSVAVVQDLKGAPRKPVPTASEERFARILAMQGVRFHQQFCVRLHRSKPRKGPMWAFLDFFLPDHGIGVEVNGAPHRGRRTQDRWRAAAIRRANPDVKEIHTIWNSEAGDEESPRVRCILDRIWG